LATDSADLEMEALHRILASYPGYRDGLAEEARKVLRRGIPIRGQSIRVLLTVHEFLRVGGNNPELFLEVEEALWEAFHTACHPKSSF